MQTPFQRVTGGANVLQQSRLPVWRAKQAHKSNTGFGKRPQILAVGLEVEPLLVILLVGTLAYLWWKRRTTTLTRLCRWREDKAEDDWRCASCGARTRSDGAPSACLREQS